jgi:hypothetical protein
MNVIFLYKLLLWIYITLGTKSNETTELNLTKDNYQNINYLMTLLCNCTSDSMKLIS